MSDSKAKAAVLKTLSDDLGKALHSLASRTPYRSVVWRLFKSRGGSEKQYGINNLVDLLEDIRQGSAIVGVMHYPHPDIDEAKNNPELADILRGASIINLTDFLMACCYDKTMLDNWMDEIVSVVMAPMHLPDSETNCVISRVLYKINEIVDTHNTLIH